MNFKLLAFLCALLYANCINSQSADAFVQIRNFNTLNGLLHNSIDKITFSDNGKLWILTLSGIQSFNGLSFESSYNHHLSPPCIDVFKDSTDQVYTVDSDYNLYQLHSSNESIKEKNTDYEIFLNNRIIQNDLFHKENGLIPSRNSIGHLKMFYDCSYIDYFDGNIIHVNPKFSLQNKDHKYSYKILNEQTIRHRSNLGPIQFKNEKDGGIWQDVILEGALKTFDPIAINKEGYIFQGDGLSFLLYNYTIFELTINANGQLDGKAMANNVNLSKKDNSLVCGAYSKNKNTFALGSTNQGLFILNFHHFKARSNCNQETLNTGKECATYGQLVLENNDIRTAHHKLYKPDGRHIDLPYNSPVAWTLLEKDHLGNLWFMDSFTLVKKGSEEMIRYEINWIFNESPKGFVHIEDSYFIGAGKRIFKIEDKTVKHVQSIPSTRDVEIQQFFKEGDNNFLIATSFGVYRYNINSNGLSPLSNTLKMNCRRIEQTDSGNTILFTYGDGYFLLKNDECLPLPLDKENNLLFAHSCIKDEFNSLWIPSNNGLYRVLEEDLIQYSKNQNESIYIESYDMNNGFLTNEFNGNANVCVKTNDGMISLSNVTGLLQFYPHKIQSTSSAKLEISKISIDGQIIPSSDHSYKINAPYSELQIDLNTVYYKNEKNLKISYQIPSISENWTMVSPNELSITLPRLKGGSHDIIFQIQTQVGKENIEQLKLKIETPKKAMENNWFLLLISTTLMGLLLLFFKRKRDKKRAQEEKIRFIENEKNQLIRIIEKQKEDQARNDLVVNALIHDVKTPLKYAEKVASSLSSNWEDYNKLDKKEILDILNETILQTNAFLQAQLNWVKVNKANLSYTAFNAFNLCQKIIDSHLNSDKIKSEQLRIINSTDSNLIIKSDSNFIEILLRNLVDNSVKYSNDGEINLCIHEEANEFIITCSDMGIGMTDELINALSSPDLNQSTELLSKGLGYKIIEEIVEILNGTLNIQSNIGEFKLVVEMNIPIQS